MRPLILLLSLTFVGCNGLKRLTDGSETPPPPIQVPQAPSSLNLPLIQGYTPTKYELWLPLDSQVLLEKNQPYISAWVFQGNRWEHPLIPLNESNRSITYDHSTGMLKFTGFAGNAYLLIYQWIPN